MIKAIINIEAPRPRVFAALTDYSRYKDWLPGCEESNIVASNGSSTDAEITISSMKRMKLGLRFDAQPTQCLNFRMVSGKDIKAYAGSYRLIDSAAGDGTVVVAELEIDAGPMAPRFLVDRMAKKAVNDTGVALNNYIRKLPPDAAAAAAPSAKLSLPAGPRRSRRILHIVKTSAGLTITYMGRTYVSRD